MKLFSFLALLFFSVQGFTQTKMGHEAVEMFRVLSHPNVQQCLANENLDLINVEISKTSARCLGCNTYEISGYRKSMDMASNERVFVLIRGRAVPGVFRTWIQTYTCKVRDY